MGKQSVWLVLFLGLGFPHVLMGKKFRSGNFKKLIPELRSLPLREQDAAMEMVLTDGMGNISQLDDILVLGQSIKKL